MSSRKEWTILGPHKTAHCERCKATSAWVTGVRFGGKELTYWRWWKRFKQTHSRCIERQHAVVA